MGGGKAQGVVLVLLVMAGGLMWAKTLAAGYSLNQQDLVRLIWKLGSLILLPITLWILIVRRMGVK